MHLKACVMRALYFKLKSVRRHNDIFIMIAIVNNQCWVNILFWNYFPWSSLEYRPAQQSHTAIFGGSCIRAHIC